MLYEIDIPKLTNGKRVVKASDELEALQMYVNLTIGEVECVFNQFREEVTIFDEEKDYVLKYQIGPFIVGLYQGW